MLTTATATVYLPTIQLLKIIPILVLATFPIVTFLLNERRIVANLPVASDAPTLSFEHLIGKRATSNSTDLPLCSKIRPYLPTVPTPTRASIYLVSKRYSLNICALRKSMSSMLAAITCYLTDQAMFKQRNLTLAALFDDEEARTHCHRTNDFYSLRKLIRVTNTTVNFWNYLAVIRDPVDRFLSGFVDKCIRERKRYKKAYGSVCYKCGRNMSCFLDVQYQRAKDIAKGKVTPRRYKMEDLHFMPQSWYCDFQTNLDRYTLLRYPKHRSGEMKRFTDKLLQFLENRGVPKNVLESIRAQVLHGKTNHVTYERKDRRELETLLRARPEIMTKLLRLYRSDYEMFGFEMPCRQE